MARIEEIERRLQNWARWHIGRSGGGLGYAQAPLAERVDGGGWDAQARIPTSDCEAEETEAAVLALPSPLPDTLRVFYLSGKGMDRKAQQLGCAVATVYSRIDQAHRMLDRWFAEKLAISRRERARVEALQRSSSARGSFTN